MSFQFTITIQLFIFHLNILQFIHKNFKNITKCGCMCNNLKHKVKSTQKWFEQNLPEAFQLDTVKSDLNKVATDLTD